MLIRYITINKKTRLVKYLCHTRVQVIAEARFSCLSTFQHRCEIVLCVMSKNPELFQSREKFDSPAVVKLYRKILRKTMRCL